jgi:hypothetical protein
MAAPWGHRSPAGIDAATPVLVAAIHRALPEDEVGRAAVHGGDFPSHQDASIAGVTDDEAAVEDRDP